MVIFQDIQDLEDWLRPMDYVQFWEAVAPYGFSMQERDHCDGQIARGEVEPDLILSGLKFMAVVELSHSLSLKDRIYDPVTAQYLNSVH
jgi:hypothetical protein